MKNKIFSLFIIVFVIFFVFPLNVKANYGDLNYRISSISISGSTVTLKGWAFIHRTNNYSGTDHTILVQAYNNSTDSVIETKTVSGSSGHDFYCQLYLRSGTDGAPTTCTSTSLKYTYHACVNDSSGVGSGTKCYYENMDFTVSFDVSSWAGVTNEDQVVFRIAATNSDFREKLSYTSYYGAYNYGGLSYTRIEDVYIPSSAVHGTLENDFIVLDSSTSATQVEYLAAYAEFRVSGFTTGMAAFKQNGSVVGCDSNFYDLKGMDGTYYSVGVKISGSQMPYDFNGITGYSWFYCPGNNYTFKNYASHMKVTGDTPFIIIVNGGKKCPPVTPNSGTLNCNGSTVFNSDCPELTVKDESISKSANVSISQTGTVSAILTPDSVYQGGGFNFGIIYTNTIRWDCVSGDCYDISSVMEDRIEDYDSYVAGLNITELKFNGELSSFQLKKDCDYSSYSNDYYGTDLTVTCLFYIPESELEGEGIVNYITDSEGLGISNKYYTPLSYSGDFTVDAKIEGMNRLVASYAREDSEDESIAWSGVGYSGEWNDTIENCKVNVYPLFYKNGNYNFIYRPIDIYDPFPNGRNPGINWYDWYSVNSNKDRLESTYSRKQYSVIMDSTVISDIRNYNSGQSSQGGYFDWDTMYDTMHGVQSPFVDSYFDVKRENIVGDDS